MADDADRAVLDEERYLEAAVAAARGDILPGKQGDCDLCGEWSGRLIEGVCAPCRDMEETKRKRRMGR